MGTHVHTGSILCRLLSGQAMCRLIDELGGRAAVPLRRIVLFSLAGGEQQKAAHTSVATKLSAINISGCGYCTFIVIM